MAVAVEHLTLSSSCHRCAAELRPPAKRNTVYLQRPAFGGPWTPRGSPMDGRGMTTEPFCPACAKATLETKTTG